MGTKKLKIANYLVSSLNLSGNKTIFKNILFRSALHCSTFCNSNLDCSAFTFDEKNGKCNMGKKYSFQNNVATQNDQEITVHVISSGKMC